MFLYHYTGEGEICPRGLVLSMYFLPFPVCEFLATRLGENPSPSPHP